MIYVDIFSPFGNTRDISHNFLTLLSEYFHVFCNAKSLMTFYLGLCQNLKAVEGAFQNRKSGLFYARK